MLKCSEPGCKNDAIECRLPDDTYQSYCHEHAGKHGFCKLCGEFWGGIESFEFIHPDICDNCQSEIEADDERHNRVYDGEDDNEIDPGWDE